MRKLPLVLWMVVLALAPLGRGADLVDRIVATVNGHVILQSDWDDAIRFEAFVEGRPLDRMSDHDRARALDRLIDQELLREQAQGPETSQPPAEEVQQRIMDLQKEHKANTSSQWHAVLAKYGLAQKQVESWLAHDIAVLHQVEARLRPTVQIAPQTIETYYQETFLPQLRKAGAQDVPLAQVSGRIREILTEQKVNELFTSWLQTLRSESKISTPATPPPSPTGGQGS
jgi:peptidyl-prolyl cis-trans isomerase SurA